MFQHLVVVECVVSQVYGGVGQCGVVGKKMFVGVVYLCLNLYQVSFSGVDYFIVGGDVQCVQVCCQFSWLVVCQHGYLVLVGCGICVYLVFYSEFNYVGVCQVDGVFCWVVFIVMVVKGVYVQQW